MFARCHGDLNDLKFWLVGAVLLAIAGTPFVFPARSRAGTILDSGQEKPGTHADIAHGKKVYDARCEICHYSASTQKKVGPGLKGMMARRKYANGMKVDDESLRAWIEKGGKDMPGYKGVLKEDEVRDLIAYMKTL
jgi:cytochrome c